jgi:methionyl aminopeptidase
LIRLKSKEDIAAMRSAGTILRRALVAAGEAVAPGVSTSELDVIIRDSIIGDDARPAFKGYHGFPGNACISVNSEVVHGIPGDTVLVEGDLVSIDVGVEKDGFHADSCETFAVGQVSEGAQRLMEVTRKSLALGIAQARPGARLGDISNAVQVYVEASGFSVVRELVGHGIGRDLHEEPQVPNFGPAGQGPKLVVGMVLAIEPMVNEGRARVRTLDDDWTVVTADGKLSAHFEHTVAITEQGPVILTGD